MQKAISFDNPGLTEASVWKNLGVIDDRNAAAAEGNELVAQNADGPSKQSTARDEAVDRFWLWIAEHFPDIELVVAAVIGSRGRHRNGRLQTESEVDVAECGIPTLDTAGERA